MSTASDSLPCSTATRDVGPIRRVTLAGLAVNCVLAVVKAVAGWTGGSQALLADAVHSLSDSTTDLAVLIGSAFWSAPADPRHPHGHGRIETLVTLLIGVLLAAMGAGVAYHALTTITQPRHDPPGWIAMATALVAWGVKEGLYHWTIAVGRRHRSSAVIANAWHHRSDGWSSVPVALAVLAARLNPDWVFLDQVAALIVAVFIFQVAWSIAWPALDQLVDAGASEQQQSEMRDLVATIPGVHSVHALRTRHIGPGLQVDLHVEVDADMTVRQGHAIATEVERQLVASVEDVIDVLVHVEPHEPGDAPTTNTPPPAGPQT